MVRTLKALTDAIVIIHLWVAEDTALGRPHPISIFMAVLIGEIENVRKHEIPPCDKSPNYPEGNVGSYAKANGTI